MEDEEKPFMCPELGCGMSFTNDDHLSVHLRKHDMSLALNLSSVPGVLSPLALFTDQTPTPTKFLKNCEELGLFQELSKSENPFDDSFKKANLLDNLDPTSEDNQTELFQGQLETPQPPSTGSEGVIGTTKVKAEPVDLSYILPKKRKKFLSQNSSSIPTSTTSDDEDESKIVSSSAGKVVCGPVSSDSLGSSQESVSTVSSSTIDLSTTVSTDVSVETQNGSTTSVPTQNMMVMLLTLPNGQVVPFQVPTTHVLSKPASHTVPPILPISSPPLQTQLTTSPHLQTVSPAHIILPAGHPANQIPNVVQIAPIKTDAGALQSTIPLSVRSAGIGTSTGQIAQGGLVSQGNSVFLTNTVGGSRTVILNSTKHNVSRYGVETIKVSPVQNTSQQNSSGSQLYIKQRLKAALQNQSTPSSNRAKFIQPVTEIKQEPITDEIFSIASTQNQPTVTISTSDNHYSYSNSHSGDGSLSQGGEDDDDDGEVRRRKLLERNRAAAARCREKRKHWVVNLEHKADELSKTNNRLSDEIQALRNEVCVLKTLLIAHKDCPVTQQQRSMGLITAQTLEIPPSNSQTSHMAKVKKEPQVLVRENPIVITDDDGSSENGSSSVNQESDELDIMEISISGADNSHHLGVITGSHSTSLISKIINLEQLNNTQGDS